MFIESIKKHQKVDKSVAESQKGTGLLKWEKRSRCLSIVLVIDFAGELLFIPFQTQPLSLNKLFVSSKH
jgi:hypothetical protein